MPSSGAAQRMGPSSPINERLRLAQRVNRSIRFDGYCLLMPPPTRPAGAMSIREDVEALFESQDGRISTVGGPVEFTAETANGQPEADTGTQSASVSVGRRGDRPTE